MSDLITRLILENRNAEKKSTTTKALIVKHECIDFNCIYEFKPGAVLPHVDLMAVYIEHHAVDEVLDDCVLGKLSELVTEFEISKSGKNV
jgi:hypothetical protein